MQIKMTERMAEAKAKLKEFSDYLISHEMTGAWCCDAGFPVLPALIIISDILEDCKCDLTGEQFKSHVVTIKACNFLVPELSTRITFSRLVDASVGDHFDVAIAEIGDCKFEVPVPLELFLDEGSATQETRKRVIGWKRERLRR